MFLYNIYEYVIFIFEKYVFFIIFCVVYVFIKKIYRWLFIFMLFFKDIWNIFLSMKFYDIFYNKFLEFVFWWDYIFVNRCNVIINII